MNSATNRFKHLLAQDGQDILNENADILTLPEGAGEDPEVHVDESGTGFPAIDFNFLEAKPDLDTFNDDVAALIEHLADLQVPMATIEKAISLINENQGGQQNPEEGLEEEAPAEEEMQQDDGMTDPQLPEQSQDNPSPNRQYT